MQRRRLARFAALFALAQPAAPLVMPGKALAGRPCAKWQPTLLQRAPRAGKPLISRVSDPRGHRGSTMPRLTRRLRANETFAIKSKQAISTLMRVALPTVLATVLGFVYFDNLSIYIRSTLDMNAIRLLMDDEAQFIQNFLTVIGLLFSILAGNAYSALYQQQESTYFALFQEVSEAKSLLEQTTLVCQGRPFYQSALRCMRDYVKNDLRRLDIPPSELLSSRPMEDPLESIMYMTSVGVPSIVYETVKNLRQARGYRLGAMQRKFPFLGIALLYLLAAVELLAFPLLGAGTATSGGILSLQSFLFACLCGAHMLVLRIIQELWQSSGGVFNVDEVLQQMVFGLEEELEMRSNTGSDAQQYDSTRAEEWRRLEPLGLSAMEASEVGASMTLDLDTNAQPQPASAESTAQHDSDESYERRWNLPGLPLARKQRAVVGRARRASWLAFMQTINRLGK